ncbi:MAG: hypothetical protein ABJA94_08410 [Rhodoglobus sp.]
MSRTDTTAPLRSWREPASLLPLHWGHYRDRYILGLVLIVGGAIQLQGSNTYTVPFLLIGTAAHATGWSIMPARGWRRLLAVIPATSQIWFVLTGPMSMWTLVVPYICWLVVRHRPAAAYVTVLLPLANGIIVSQYFTEYSAMPVVLSISMAVFVASAWLARSIAKFIAQRTETVALPSPSPLK